MRSTSVAALGKVRGYPGLALAVLLIGLADAVSGSYLTLFATQAARLAPLALGAFMTAISLSGIGMSAWLGRRSDRGAGRAPALLSLALGGIGFALLAFTTNFVLLLLIACLFLGGGGAAFPQLFAFAKRALDAAGAALAERGVTTLRSVWSVAWAVGPLLGAALLPLFGFRGVFLAAALCFVLAALPVLRANAGAWAASPRPSHAPAPFHLVWPLALSFALFHTAMFAGSIALPVYVTQNLGGTGRDVGVIFSVCALLEIPVIWGLSLLPSRWRRTLPILAGFALFVMYFISAALLPSVAWLVAAQALRAAAIGAVGGLGIPYFQDLMPRHVGAATALYANTGSVGSLLAGLAAGGWAQLLGYHSVFWLCAALLGVGAALLLVFARRRLSDSSPVPAD